MPFECALLDFGGVFGCGGCHGDEWWWKVVGVLVLVVGGGTCDTDRMGKFSFFRQ